MQQILLWGLGIWLVSRAGRRNNVPLPTPGPSRPGIPTQMRPGGGGSSAGPSAASASSGSPINRGGDPSQRGITRRQQV